MLQFKCEKSGFRRKIWASQFRFRLGFVDCDLPSCPPLNAFGHIHTLDLHGNALSRFPPEIARLSTLTNLDVSRNQLSDLPFSELTKLRQLYANNNLLQDIPYSIGRLTNLESISLANNPILPKGLQIFAYNKVTTQRLVRRASRKKMRVAAALFVLMCHRRASESIWATLPVDVVRIIARLILSPKLKKRLD